ncbi:hypothetical protein [Streptomyces sp. DW26H14]|uniref:hypothetical protein n=1 Tax=Streptomyces sp. DW26H14 TaxID=3435395 RepID=UPI00403D6008
MAVDEREAATAGGGRASAPRVGAARPVGAVRLPCGRLLGEAWEQARDVAGPPDAHTAGCPYCWQAVARLAALDAAVLALRKERPADGTVAEHVMRAVRAEGRLGRPLPLDDQDRGLRVTRSAAAAVFRRAADSVPGVRAAGCRLVPDTGGGRRVDIVMTLAVALDTPLPERAAAVRGAVVDAARRRVGIAPGRIDMRIVAVLGRDDVLPAGALLSHGAESESAR